MDKNTKRPWSWIWMIVASALCGFPGSYLIVWQNLKRIGKEDVAKKFLFIGGIITLVITIFLLFIPISRSLSSGLSTGLALIFPVWLYSNYLKEWQKQNPKVAGFSWSLLGWGLLGLILYIALVYLIDYLYTLIP